MSTTHRTSPAPVPPRPALRPAPVRPTLPEGSGLRQVQVLQSRTEPAQRTLALRLR